MVIAPAGEGIVVGQFVGTGLGANAARAANSRSRLATGFVRYGPRKRLAPQNSQASGQPRWVRMVKRGRGRCPNKSNRTAAPGPCREIEWGRCLVHPLEVVGEPRPPGFGARPARLLR